MKKLILGAVLAVLLTGCATYKFQHGEKPYDKGYVASRSGYTMLEYTVGSSNSVPQELDIAKKRFKRRRRTVEHYYKKTGDIENRFRETFVDPVVMGLKFLGGIFKMPCVAVSDYRYEHNPKYRERIDRMEREQDEKEAMRIAAIKEQLDVYIQKDLASEGSAAEETPVKAAAPAAAPVLKDDKGISSAEGVAEHPALEAPAESPVISPPQVQATTPAAAAPVKKKTKERPKVISEPKAVIIAKPLKGYSPLRVRFYGSKSYSKKARIMSYQWDFGDGDSSDKANPVNTYYSGSYYPKHFAVTLTVTDSQGNTDTAHVLIEVLNK